MVNLTGYQILAKIYESDNSLVYRGLDEADNQPVILKQIKQEYPSQEEINRYRQEYEIAQHLKSLPGVAKAYQLYQVKNSFVIILEDFGGESLKILMKSQKFTVLGFLKLAIKITECLADVHAANVIHKDINPSNIVFNPATGQVKLIDFGISTLLTKGNSATKTATGLEGTFAYISPEQTGRMNRSIDYRTDFYSLGATFYELLTNQVPFEATDAMELVHCHIAKEPVPPHEKNSEVPKVVSDIVIKLLAKTAEDRYQSAWGLKADLEECLNQFQHRGTIVSFPLGSQDISDKFQLPQKLYGRQREIEILLSAFERVSHGATEMMLIAGYSGIGKSALVQEIYKPIAQKGGYFISGKFDQFQRSTPYSAVVTAFSELVRLLLSESEEKLNQWKGKLLDSFGPNGQIIIDVIPEVELIIGPQPPVPSLKPAESQNRFNFVFQNFIRVFCTKEHPLVIFLDDLQWSDSATLKLIKLMMSDEQMEYLFLIGAYRDNEVTPTHPLIMTIDGLRHEGVAINEYTLEPLNLEQVTQLVSETLHSPPDSVRSLADLVIRKTEGNPFFVNEFLKTLYQENLLTFNTPQSSDSRWGWQWNIEQIEAVGITENVVDLMIGKLRKLPESTQEVLRLSACLGNQFDLNTLSLIHKKEASETFHDLLPAIREGLILPISDREISPENLINYALLILTYKFLHDRVQQAAYSLIDQVNKKVVHLTIGRLLLANTPLEYRIDRAFELVDHLNVGRELITDELEQVELAGLNLEAGKKAKDATAYVAAKSYLTAGIKGLPAHFWQNYYDLGFSLYKERAEVEYLNGNFEESEQFIKVCLEQSKSLLEKASIYNLLLIQYGLRAKYEEAVNVGREALEILGVSLPTEDLPSVIGAEFTKAKEQWEGREIASLVDEPEMTLPEKKMAVKLLTNLAVSAYLISPPLWTIIFLKAVNISLEYGSTPESCLAYSNYGVLLNGVFGDSHSAYQFGLLSTKLIERWNAKDLKCKALTGLANGTSCWFNHIKESNLINSEAYQAALEAGDLEYAGYALHNTALNSFYQGRNLAQIGLEIERYLQFTQKTQNQFSTDMLLGFQLIVGNLTQLTPDLFSFDLENLKESDYLQSCQSRQNLYGICIYQIQKLKVLYLYGNLKVASELLESIEQLLPFITGTLPVSDYTFYSSLVRAALYQDASEEEQPQILEKLTAAIAQMKTWASNCSENFLHKLLLLQAEFSRITGQALEAINLYDQSIESAIKYEFVQNEALGNKLAAQFWLNQGKEKIAKLYLAEASYAYQRWGATRQVELLKEQYPHLLIKNSAKTGAGEIDLTATHTSTSSNSGSLDLATVLKASQAISGQIRLDKLLSNLMKICIENAGAQSGFLILPRENSLLIAAEASVTKEEVSVLQYVPVEEIQNLPITVIKFVERTRKDVVLTNAVGEGRFTTDPYISSHQVKSVLCSPIINQGKLIGILYLENNLTTDAFTPHRLEVLQVLSSQAAISLENALLYASVEQKVADRTQELNEKNEELNDKNLRLEQTLQELRKTQAQLIQTEKMSSLGQMVAGVAHEINNPVSFIYGNLTPASEYVADLLKLVHLYQTEYPQPNFSIQEMTQDIDLEFLVDDLQKLLNSMKVGAERIRNIVIGLRNFSRLDEAEMKPVDIHEGIDSTLMLLQPRLREDGERLGIEIIKNYQKLPKVTCYASQLNQVFMNILSNGIDALEVLRKTETERSPMITIQTSVKDSQFVVIRISDNGLGMKEATRQKIFDPFFTTKPVGSGTGLGLSISYQIIVDSHGGQIYCNSAPGQGAEFVVEIPIKSSSR
jgi:predicted ATPase/signal transduction histidine kinase/tRNA A-37 threonylcarbamoyl transferase component Bud32